MKTFLATSGVGLHPETHSPELHCFHQSLLDAVSLVSRQLSLVLSDQTFFIFRVCFAICVGLCCRVLFSAREGNIANLQSLLSQLDISFAWKFYSCSCIDIIFHKVISVTSCLVCYIGDYSLTVIVFILHKNVTFYLQKMLACGKSIHVGCRSIFLNVGHKTLSSLFIFFARET